jgi:signal transduction histidine kinase
LDTYHSQKQFIENASHELQTPVAVSINKLELLAEKSDLSEASLESVGQVIQTLERLTRLNRSLLLLSRIENRQFEDTEEVSFNAIARQLINEFSDFAEYKDVTMTLHENAELHIEMQKDLALIMISNILKNAIVHNYTHGTVHIVIEKDSLKISNSGSPLALDPDRIFSRFYKNSKDSGSTGLGLAIVKAIADLYGFRVGYLFDGVHVVSIQFK